MTGYNFKGDVATSNGNGHSNGHTNGHNPEENNGEYVARDSHTSKFTASIMCSRDCCSGKGGSNKPGNACDKKGGNAVKDIEIIVPTPQSLLNCCTMCSRDCCSNPKGKAGDKTAINEPRTRQIVPTAQSQLRTDNRIQCFLTPEEVRALRVMNEDEYPYEAVQEIADFIIKGAGMRPKIGIICGSGLGSLADLIQDAKVFEYEKIPNFPVSTVEGHAGKLVVGTLEGANVMAMQGRFHFYEGYPLAKCSMPVRVMKLCGAEYLFATNAAGGINPKFAVGDIMLMHDHVNMLGLAGNSPLQGPNDPRFGPRFPALVNSYNRDLINKAIEIGKSMGIESNMHVGVYSCLGGPNYETIAELKALRTMGIDAVGMSTVHEVITARHCDMKVFAFSLITNKCSIEYSDKKDEEANHEEVMAVAKNRQKACCELVSRLIADIQKGA